MKVFVCLFLVALAVAAEAGMMGPPGGAMGGPPGGPGMGPPPFVQAIIAGKGKPFGAGGPPMGGAIGGGAMGGGPGMGGAMGPPPFVQAIIAGKGKPFGAAPAPAPEPMPDYIQSFLAAKAAMMPPIPMGPPPFIQQLIQAKNAAAAKQAEDEALLAQYLAAQAPPAMPGY